MVTTVTTSTIAGAATASFASLIVFLVLLALLSMKILVNVSDSPRVQALSHTLNLVMFPLLIVFVMTLVLQVLTFPGSA